MTPLTTPQHHAVDVGDRALDQTGVHELHARQIGAKPARISDERDRNGIQAKQIRPELGHDMNEMIEPFGVDRSQHGRVNRRHRTRVTTSEGDEILIGLLDFSDPPAQRCDRSCFEIDHLAHNAMLPQLG